MSNRSVFWMIVGGYFLGAALAGAQETSSRSSRMPPGWEHTSHVVVPQRRGFSLSPGGQGLQVEFVHVAVRIVEQTATTVLDIQVRNPAPGPQAEAVLLLPVPAGAVVHSFLFAGQGAEPSARLLPADEARRTYDSIVARVRDPALLEFAGFNLIRSSVFPVPAGGAQRVQITYEHLLPADGDRVDYVLPRSESLGIRTDWRIEVTLQTKTPISMVYSPSHEYRETRQAPNRIVLRVDEEDASEPGAFFLSYLREQDGVTASLYAYPDPKIGGGYFLLLAGLPAGAPEGATPRKREVTIVIDRSGSMAGPKMDQVRAAALQIIEGLEDGEAFNIIDYSTTAASFAPGPVRKDPKVVREARAYLASLRTTGGTNLHDALLEALRSKPLDEEFLPLVLFLTDGLPTVGNTSERAIREIVEKGNPHHRRVFTFGVGSDVNAPLLDRVADVSRAKTTYVLPGEDVEVKVAQVFERLHGPVLSDGELVTLTPEGDVTTRAVREIIPHRVPDLFGGDQFVLLGQYVGEAPLSFRLHGDYFGHPRDFTFRFDLSKATTRNAFVPRLWAGRRIAMLVDEIRQAGAAQPGRPFDAPPLNDPRFRELTEEILRLSTEFGILTEYTAFLATEGTDLGNWELLLSNTRGELDANAVKDRSGLGGLNQALNNNDQKAQTKLNRKNKYWDKQLNRVEVANVQQVSDRAFLRQGNRWIDTRIVAGQNKLSPDQVVEYGSKEFLELLETLSRDGRQGLLSLDGETLLELQGKSILIRNEGTN